MDLKGFIASERPAFLLALQFLTRLKVSAPYSPEAMRASPRWYPAVGVVVGGLAALAYGLCAWLFAPLLAVMLAVATAIVVTGALHEDGFADACDGLGGTRPKDRVLEIMRDSRIGTYGVLGLLGMVGCRVAGLHALPPEAVGLALIAGHAASRASVLWVMSSSDYVRDTGAGRAVAGGMDGHALRVAALTMALALIPLGFVLPFFSVLTGLAGLVLGHVAMRRWYEPRLGGYTGDCLGAVQQCSELGFYLGLLVTLA